MKLDLGCSDKKPSGYIGCDIRYFKYPKGQFIRCDINNKLPFEDKSFDEVRAIQVIVHIDNKNKISFMNEIYRILEYGGKFIAEFPPPVCKNGNINNSFFTDPTHYSWWMPGTFMCFCASFRFKEKLGSLYEGYCINTNFEIIDSRWINNILFHIELKKY